MHCSGKELTLLFWTRHERAEEIVPVCKRTLHSLKFSFRDTEGIYFGEFFRCNEIIPGAIIGNGDRKSWDPRAPMIWDNFSIFRTNCAILTSYIRADPRACRGLSRGCCHVAWSNGESWETLRDYLAYFSQRWQGIRQGIRNRALICSFMLRTNGKGGFFRGENKTSISRWEWIIRSARASCKLTRMFSSDLRI